MVDNASNNAVLEQLQRAAAQPAHTSPKLQLPQQPINPRSQDSKSLGLPDVIERILEGVSGEDKNRLLAFIGNMIAEKTFEIIATVIKAWQLFTGQSMEYVLEKLSSPSSLPINDDQEDDYPEQIKESSTTSTSTLTFTPAEEKIRQELLKLSDNISTLSKKITANLEQAALAKKDFIDHLKQTPAHSLMGILHDATQYLSSIPKQLSSPPDLFHNFILDFATDTFDHQKWIGENLPKHVPEQLRLDCQQAITSLIPHRVQLQPHARKYRAPLEEMFENLSKLTTSLDDLTQLLSLLPAKKMHIATPTPAPAVFGGQPIEAFRGILEAKGTPQPNAQEHRAALVILTAGLGRALRSPPIIPSVSPSPTADEKIRPTSHPHPQM